MTDKIDGSTGILSSYRVIDFSRLAPGPMTTMALGDLGADVIKVEEPGGGQRARDERVLQGKPRDEYSTEEWHSRSFSPLERNKRSVAVDLRSESGRDIALRLLSTADVAVEGFRPGVMQRLGLDYQAARRVNKRIVYCSITGYGQVGSRTSLAGHDLNYLAYAGALSLIGGTDGSPVVPINVIADYAAGSLRAVSAILGALLSRERTGEGQWIDVAMADGVVGLLAVEVARYLSSGLVPKAGETYLTGGMAYYNVYETREHRWITIACNEPHFYRRLCEFMDLPDLADRQFGDAGEQRQSREILGERFRIRTLPEWCDALGSQQIPFAPVRTIDEVVNDECFREHGLFVTVEHPEFGNVVQVGSVVPLAGTDSSARRDAAKPGADFHSVLSELGYQDSEIDDFIERDIVAIPVASDETLTGLDRPYQKSETKDTSRPR